jgi:hypothetical protein
VIVTAVFGEKAEIFAWIFFISKGLGEMSLWDKCFRLFEWWWSEKV